MGWLFLPFWFAMSKNKIYSTTNRSQPNFCMISGNLIDLTIYTRRIAHRVDYHIKIMDMVAFIFVEINYLKTLAQTFIITARQNQFIQEKFFNKAPVCWIVIAMNTKSAFTK